MGHRDRDRGASRVLAIAGILSVLVVSASVIQIAALPTILGAGKAAPDTEPAAASTEVINPVTGAVALRDVIVDGNTVRMQMENTGGSSRDIVEARISFFHPEDSKPATFGKLGGRDSDKLEVRDGFESVQTITISAGETQPVDLEFGRDSGTNVGIGIDVKGALFGFTVRFSDGSTAQYFVQIPTTDGTISSTPTPTATSTSTATATSTSTATATSTSTATATSTSTATASPNDPSVDITDVSVTRFNGFIAETEVTFVPDDPEGNLVQGTVIIEADGQRIGREVVSLSGREGDSVSVTVDARGTGTVEATVIVVDNDGDQAQDSQFE